MVFEQHVNKLDFVAVQVSLLGKDRKGLHSPALLQNADEQQTIHDKTKIQIFTCKYILEVFKIVRSHLGGCTAGPDNRLHQGCLVQCGGKGGEKGGVEKRIIQQKQNAVQRYGAIRNAGHGVMVVLNLFPNCCSALLKALQYDKQALLPVSRILM